MKHNGILLIARVLLIGSLLLAQFDIAFAASQLDKPTPPPFLECLQMRTR